MPRQLGTWIALVAGWLALLVAIHQPGRLSLEVAAEAGAVEALGPHAAPVDADEPVGEVREAFVEGEGQGSPPTRRAIPLGTTVASLLFSEVFRELFAETPVAVPLPPAAPAPRVTWYALAPAPARAPPLPSAAV